MVGLQLLLITTLLEDWLKKDWIKALPPTKFVLFTNSLASRICGNPLVLGACNWKVITRESAFSVCVTLVISRYGTTVKFWLVLPLISFRMLSTGQKAPLIGITL